MATESRSGARHQIFAMDLTNPRLIKLKAVLFLAIVLIASTLLICRTPELSSALLLIVALWAACRSYYFAFYVLQHYVDPSFRYSGLGALLRAALRRRRT
jgi:hypothetical protein